MIQQSAAQYKKRPWGDDDDGPKQPHNKFPPEEGKDDWSTLRKCNKCHSKTYIKKNTCANPTCELNPLKIKLREMENYINQMWAGHEQVLLWMEHDAHLAAGGPGLGADGGAGQATQKYHR